MKAIDSFIETEKKEVQECFNQFIVKASSKRKKKIMNKLIIIMGILREEAVKKLLFQKKLKAFLSWRNPEAITALIQLNVDNKICL